MCPVRFIFTTSITVLLLGVVNNQLALPPCPVNLQWFPQPLPMHCVMQASVCAVCVWPCHNCPPPCVCPPQSPLAFCPACACPLGYRPPHCPACPSCSTCHSCTSACTCKPATCPSCHAECTCGTQNQTASNCTCNQGQPTCNCGNQHQNTPTCANPPCHQSVIVMPIYTPVIHSHPPENTFEKPMQSFFQTQFQTPLQPPFQSPLKQPPWQSNSKILYVNRDPKSFEDTRRFGDGKVHVEGSVTTYRKGQEALIPMFSYMTADGHVVYQKQLSPRRAVDFMNSHNARSHRILSHRESLDNLESEDEGSQNEGYESEGYVMQTPRGHRQSQKRHPVKSPVRNVKSNVKRPSNNRKL